MAAPTDAQLQTFFTTISELRTLFPKVLIEFDGNNATPTVWVYWDKASTQAASSIQSATDGIDDLNNLLAAAFAQYEAEGSLRAQLATAAATVASLSQQLAALGQS